MVDSQNRVTPRHKLISLPGNTILARCEQGNEEWPEAIEQLLVPTASEAGSQVDLQALMSALSQRDINHIWVEAGAGLAGALLSAGLVDELIIYQAPKLMGSDSRGADRSTGG